MEAKQLRTAFVSGPLEVSVAYFTRYYQSRLDTAIAAGNHFVMGPVSGIDALALSYLTAHSGVHPSQVKVYMASFEVAARPTFVCQLQEDGVQVEEVEGAKTTWDRDAAMTKDSEYDILRYRTEWEQKAIFQKRWRARVSNTERNERRRARYDAGGSRVLRETDVDAGTVGKEQVDIKYIRHVAGGLQNRLSSWGGRWMHGDDDGVDECVGACDGHRDVVYWPLLLRGQGAFGFGDDGMRSV